MQAEHSTDGATVVDPGAGRIYVGLMSGTSLDGISAAVVQFLDAPQSLAHHLLGFTLSEYSSAQRDRVAAAMQRGSAEEYCRLNFVLGDWLADAAEDAIAQAGVARASVTAIASHGQTLWHVPGQSTWQTGESAVIAERLGIDVVSDFRVRDVAAGGQGAPLVPMADSLLYSHPERWRLLQNIGGIGNVTVVPPGGDVTRTVAFDTGPGVAVIDAVVRMLYPGLRYDDRGAIATSGKADEAVVESLLRDPYFAQSPPKSTGREYFGTAYADALIAVCEANGCRPADTVATAVALTARSIADAYRAFTPAEAEEVIVSGGGTRNVALMQALTSAVEPRRVVAFDDLYYDAEAKEAVAFALLAHLHVTGRAGNITAATGARGPRVLGKLAPA